MPQSIVPFLIAAALFFDTRHIASIVPNAAGGRFYEPGRERAFYLGVEAVMGVARGAGARK